MSLPMSVMPKIVPHHGNPIVTCRCSMMSRTRLGRDVQLVKPSALRSPRWSPLTTVEFIVSITDDDPTSKGIVGVDDAEDSVGTISEEALVDASGSGVFVAL